MACTVEFNGEKYSESEFKAKLMEGEMDDFVFHEERRAVFDNFVKGLTDEQFSEFESTGEIKENPLTDEQKNNIKNLADEYFKTASSGGQNKRISDGNEEATTKTPESGEKAKEQLSERTGSGNETEVSTKQLDKEAREGIKKTLVTKRVYEGEFREGVKKRLEEIGLLRDVDNLETASVKADKIIEEIGQESALDAVRKGDIEGATAAAIFEKVIEKVENEALLDNSPEKQAELDLLQAELYDEWGKRQHMAGSFNAYMARVKEKSAIGYKFGQRKAEWEKITGEQITKEVEQRFKEYDEKLADMAKRIDEAEKKAKEAEEKQAVENIKASLKRSKKRDKNAEGNALIGEAFSDIADILGAKLNAVGDKKVTLSDALTKLGKGLILKGEATAEDVIEKIKIAIQKKYGKEIDISEYEKDIKGAIEEDATKVEIKNGKLSVPNSLVRELVESGVDNIDDLVTEVKKYAKDIPDISDREIRDAITNYGKIANPTKDELILRVNKIKRVGRLLSKLEDVKNNKKTTKSEKAKAELDKQELDLKKQIKDALKELPLDEQELAEKKAKQLSSSKTRTKERIEELQKQINDGVFKKEEKKPLLPDSELIKLQAEKLRLQEEWDKEFYKEKLKALGKSERIKEELWGIYGLGRALVATGEWSFVGVQGLNLTARGLVFDRGAVKSAFKNAFSHMMNAEKSEEFLRKVKSQEWYPILKGSKLSLTEPHGETVARDELFNSSWTKRIWNAISSPTRLFGKEAYEKAKKANPFEGLERAADGYLNTLRVSRFMDGMKMLEMKGLTFHENPQAYKEMADVINTLTGRASLGAGEKIAPTLSKVFFSPRNWASAIKTATPYALVHFGKMRAGADGFKPTVAQKMAMADLSTTIGTTLGIVTLAALRLNNDDDKETAVVLDPRSSDFGKIKLGDRRIDPWGGKIQQIVMLSRLITEVKVGTKGANKGIEKPITRMDVLQQIATNKLNPTTGALVEYLSTKKNQNSRVNKYGEKYSAKERLEENTHPMFFSTLADLYHDDPSALNGLLAFASFFGVGVSVYGDKTDKKEREREKQVKDK